MIEFLHCLKCGADFPPETVSGNSITCCQCGYITAFFPDHVKTISGQIKSHIVSMSDTEIEKTINSLETSVGSDVLKSSHIHDSIKTMSKKLSAYVSGARTKKIQKKSEYKSDGMTDYLIDEKLDEGGMGIVFRARQLSLEREVVLKMTKERLLILLDQDY